MLLAGTWLVPSDIERLRNLEDSFVEGFIHIYEIMIFGSRYDASDFDYQLVNYATYEQAGIWKRFPEDAKRVRALFNFIGQTYLKGWKPFHEG